VPGGDPAAFVRAQVQGSGSGPDEEVTPGRVRVAAPAETIRRQIPDRYASVQPDGADACLVTTRGGWKRDFIVWMATLGAPIEVLEPPELRELARDIAGRLTAASG
jgi:predicted DNA-binding transcriptional regulator YafY